ncbi:unnamed protein product [Clonostachys rhizophaga]|uniref:Uncharacterized protein n=1 Tax=Clonostachys rhizophaga TaxID=160324 RepID=A0A9N9VF47_9HYPO|nr:unnamed protein product [Clonostachys rhizophaga]
MPRAKQGPRKSLGGGAIVKQAPKHEVLHFKDHAGQSYSVRPTFPRATKAVPKLGLQLYLLGSRTEPAVQELARRFLGCEAIHGWRGMHWPRVDAYSGFETVESCIEHHRREKTFRKSAIKEMKRSETAGLSEEDAAEKLRTKIRGREPLPHIVPTWCPSEAFWNEIEFKHRYRSWIIIIPEDRLSWEDVMEKGLLSVRFDLDVTPAMHTFCWDGQYNEPCELPGDNVAWVLVQKTGLDLCKPVDCKLLCARDQPNRGFLDPDVDPEEHMRIAYGWHTPGTNGRLFDEWSDSTEWFRDCAYSSNCDACNDGEPHDICDDELNEHYFDDDGLCIACRR